MKDPKINLPDGMLQRIRSSSTSSKILFVLCCVCGLLGILSGSLDWILIAGLFGVLWIASIVLHFIKKRDMKGNPFTALTTICAGVSIFCLLFASAYRPHYNQANEPINQQWELLQDNLNDLCENTEDITDLIDHNIKVVNPFGGLNHNVFITDANHNVIYAYSSWKTNGEKQLHALVCPSPLEDNHSAHLMLLVNAKGDVVSTFQMEREWMNTTASPSYKSLTISDDVNTPSESDDALFQKYFPSFGTNIDNCASLLKDASLHVGTHDNGTYKWVHDIQNWNGEVEGISGINLPGVYEGLVAQELNALTDEQRTALKKYLAWLDLAEQSIYPTNDINAPLEARMMSSSDGEYHLYMLYEYDYEALHPHLVRHSSKAQLRNNVRVLGMLMIPTTLVFLAFWVFVDAKRRGHNHPALWAVLTLIGNVVAWIIYMMVRPAMTVGVTGKATPRGTCPLCGTKLKSDFIACPGCGILLRNKCRNCGRALENDWSFCPYCTHAIVKAGMEGESASESTESHEAMEG